MTVLIFCAVLFSRFFYNDFFLVVRNLRVLHRISPYRKVLVKSLETGPRLFSTLNYHARLGPLWQFIFCQTNINGKGKVVCVVLNIAGFKSQCKSRVFLQRKALDLHWDFNHAVFSTTHTHNFSFPIYVCLTKNKLSRRTQPCMVIESQEELRSIHYTWVKFIYIKLIV